MYRTLSMKFLSIVGTRPQLVKLKPIVEAFRAAKLDHEYVDTGQHYDANLSTELVEDLQLPQPAVNLKVRESNQSAQIGNAILRIDSVLQDLNPDWVLVYGDTNSTLAGAIASIKRGVRVAHIESGLRSGNLGMSEEQNRVMVDHISTVLFTPTASAMENLQKEGLKERSVFVGDVMFDLIEYYKKYSYLKISKSEPYLVCTLHRAENVDNKNRLKLILEALSLVTIRVILVSHPRLMQRMSDFELTFPANLDVCDPMPHSKICGLLASSKGLITDSGGLQKEAFMLGIPTTTLRNETEWPETLSSGLNVLLPDLERLPILSLRDCTPVLSSPFGNGHAATEIVNHLSRF